MNDWEKLNAYFNQHADAKLVNDPADKNVFEDPTNSDNIMAINMIMRAGNSKEKVRQTANKIRKILKDAGFEAVVGECEGAANCRGITIMSENTLPKSFGIRSKLDGVPVGFSVIRSLDVFKGKASATKGPGA